MLTKTLKITNARNAKTLSPSHMKQCIMSESQFDFLRDIVKNVPDINVAEEQLAADDYSEDVASPAAPPPPAHHSNGSGAASGSGINAHHRIVKQCSVDATQNRPINFYGSAPAEAGPVNYSTNNGERPLELGATVVACSWTSTNWLILVRQAKIDSATSRRCRNSCGSSQRQHHSSPVARRRRRRLRALCPSHPQSSRPPIRRPSSISISPNFQSCHRQPVRRRALQPPQISQQPNQK